MYIVIVQQCDLFRKSPDKYSHQTLGVLPEKQREILGTLATVPQILPHITLHDQYTIHI